MAQIHGKQTTDVIVQEMRAIKETLAKSMNFDVDRILDDARRRQQESGRKILSPPLQRGH